MPALRTATHHRPPLPLRPVPPPLLPPLLPHTAGLDQPRGSTAVCCEHPWPAPVSNACTLMFGVKRSSCQLAHFDLHALSRTAALTLLERFQHVVRGS